MSDDMDANIKVPEDVLHALEIRRLCFCYEVIQRQLKL